MGEKGRILWGIVMLAALAVGVIGCGGDSSTGTDVEETAAESRPYPQITGAAREFLELPNGDNTVQVFGEEAPADEREAASKVIHAWTKARVAEAWVADCKLFATEYRKLLVADAFGVSEEKVKTCPHALEFFGDAASGSSGNTLTGPIDSLRARNSVESNTEKEAYAQWHGSDGKDWILPLRKEDGVWRVANASPLDRTK